jgi:hypothetical protein
MAEHFKYYPSDEEVVTPWNARYSYPSQANKATKMTPRIPPKNGASFGPGQIIRLEFPAQGYVNPLNTLLQFDVVLYAPVVASGSWAVRFQNNIQCIFNRVRLLYGANPQEDLLQYGVLVRCLTEWTATNQMNGIDQASIADGIGGTYTGEVVSTVGTAISSGITGTVSGNVVTLASASLTTANGYAYGGYITVSGASVDSGSVNGTFLVSAFTSGTSISYVSVASGTITGASITTTPVSLARGLLNTRQDQIQGLQGNFVGSAPIRDLDDNWLQTYGQGSGLVPNNTSTLIPAGCPTVTSAAVPTTGANCFSVRRYMVNFALGLFTQDKLIPTKYMASQLAIEITLAAANECIYQSLNYSASNAVQPTYAVGNVALIPEIIEFDDTYDEQFLKGLESGGVPIKFSTWHYFQFTTQGASSLQLQITERSRSVKGIFSIQRRNPPGFQYDSHACFFDTNTAVNSTAGSTMQQYQYRIGGRYFPAAPVQLTNPGGSVTNGGAEAYLELQKFLNIVGDSRLSTNTTNLSWAVPAIVNQPFNILPEYDYAFAQAGFSAVGIPAYVLSETFASCFCGNSPSSMFSCAINFETSNGIEISGLNAEEQSDISFNVMWSSAQATGFSIECFTYVDVMWVLRPNNYLDLIQ